MAFYKEKHVIIEHKERNMQPKGFYFANVKSFENYRFAYLTQGTLILINSLM